MTKVNGQIEPQIPSQITRLIPIQDTAKSLNDVWQRKLEQDPIVSLFSNYQLIGIQWLANPYTPYDTSFPGREVKNKELTNVTLEPYVQKAENLNSCIACHTEARLRGSHRQTYADFSFLFSPDK